ncbi:hypothetical protein COT42_07030 [Candidatus Saganbacteria bacterium CG08_land_8_20_14_0_20_45_16]|uniref:Uncharacterized protein n=1 Tax=Candidatus Saganbacteria bacterium CG08_land_8_20_14_0_20_45_16 TaxID=2014293 RepID=A0A2H0XVE9_UNCSA|nr:MAG: hypothetical protein COT42_07030 [Candidatus Saganbacteria bacterium CG08_land_8_20_14_0_20_45_16]
MHEETLQELVGNRLNRETRASFLGEATAGWVLSQQLRTQKATPEQIYGAWLKPFVGSLRADDIEENITQHWTPNPHFEAVTRAIARAMGYTTSEKMPLTIVSGALAPMVWFAMETWFGPLLSDGITLEVKALDIEMEGGVFTGVLRPVDSRVYRKAAAYGPSDYMFIGDCFSRSEGQGDHLVVIYKEDESCNEGAVQTHLIQHFGQKQIS